jgi:hypothetical protein
MYLPKTTISVDSRNYYLEVVSKNKNTYSVQISDSTPQIIADLPLDPMDNTLAAVLSKDVISKLGEDTEIILNALSSFLQEKIGAKEFILVPPGVVLTDYIPVQNHEFKRLRHANRDKLAENSSNMLEQHRELVDILDNQYKMITGIDKLENGLQHDKPYDEILALLNMHANFTPGKMSEYKEEDIEGAKARFNNSNMNTIALLNNEHRLCGIIRSLSMGNKFAYLSDETINQEILPLEKFQGDSIDEQEKNRAKFLLAYLVNKTCSFAKDQDHFLIIAASKREDIYDAIGFQTFPIQSDDYVVTMKLGKPGASLISIKEELLKPLVSNAEIMSNIGFMSISNQSNVANQQQDTELLKQTLSNQ